MWRVTRTDPYGFNGFKDFPTEQEADEWLQSESVQDDKDDGYSFSKKEI